MKSLVIIIPLLILQAVCQKHVTISAESGTVVKVGQNINWKGQYFFEAANKDGLTTSFDIVIADLNHITIVYIGDSEKRETYKNLKARIVQPDKISIDFNKEYGEMGTIVLEKTTNDFIISGQPIYYINPGAETRIIKKIK